MFKDYTCILNYEQSSVSLNIKESDDMTWEKFFLYKRLDIKPTYIFQCCFIRELERFKLWIIYFNWEYFWMNGILKI